MLILSGTVLLCCVMAGIALDLWLGETPRWHPLVGFGNLANAIEARWNKAAPHASRFVGVLAWCLIVLPIVAFTSVLLYLASQYNPWLAVVLHCLMLYFSLGLRSLYEHTAPIRVAIEQGDLNTARRLTSYIVSRDTEQASTQDLSKASVESLLENGCDAVFATLFWFIVAGGPGAILYRCSNTLDAMWGYKSVRLLRFGWCAARIDDVLNWFPARLTAFSYALLGNTSLALRCWREQAPAWPSPNAGPVMSSGAGALGLALGGTASYDGVLENRPPLGQGQAAESHDIARAWSLVLSTCALWVLTLCIGIGLLWLFA